MTAVQQHMGKHWPWWLGGAGAIITVLAGFLVWFGSLAMAYGEQKKDIQQNTNHRIKSEDCLDRAIKEIALSRKDIEYAAKLSAAQNMRIEKMETNIAKLSEIQTSLKIEVKEGNADLRAKLDAILRELR